MHRVETLEDDDVLALTLILEVAREAEPVADGELGPGPLVSLGSLEWQIISPCNFLAQSVFHISENYILNGSVINLPEVVGSLSVEVDDQGPPKDVAAVNEVAGDLGLLTFDEAL